MSNGKENRQLQKQSTQVETHVQVTGIFQGPLPPPDALIRYNDAHPGTANRIVRMAEREQAHRHFVENTGMLSSVGAEYFGLMLAAVLFGGVAYFGFTLIREGWEAAGVGTVITAVLGPLVTFLIARYKQHHSSE